MRKRRREKMRKGGKEEEGKGGREERRKVRRIGRKEEKKLRNVKWCNLSPPLYISLPVFVLSKVNI